MMQNVDTKMKEIIKIAESVANSRSSVLIQGESGTGKGHLAKYIHEKSDRGTNPLITVNCAQQPEMLLETELFGFEKGAFAGTVSEKRGKFEQASGGTLILDNVSELTPKLQSKILRVIESGQVGRIGAKIPMSIDVRLIAVTNKNLSEYVSSGKFSESLYYKLSSAQLMVPPLRERFADLATIVQGVVSRIIARSGRRVSEVAQEAIDKMCTHSFPGNLRELEGVLERAVMTAQDGVIRAIDISLGEKLGIAHQGVGAHSVDWEVEAQWAPGRTLEQIERAVILKSLAFHNGNRTHTARELGISIRTLRNKLNEYRRAGIEV